MQSTPLVSIVIVTWHSKAYLHRCLAALSMQTLKKIEVIIVDNGSTDGSVDNLRQFYPNLELHIEGLNRNLGFAVANNFGARIARGQWLALLNADAFPASDWVERLFEAAEKMPNAFFASRQIQADTPGLLDGEGDVYHISGLAWRRNYGFPVQEKREFEEIFSPCAAAALYPRQSFLDVGGFDEDYFSYQEDVDLGFRLRLKGLHCFYVPQAVVHHVGSASTGKQSDFAIYYGHRNLVWTYIKNMPAPLFWIFMPLHILANIITILRFFLTGHGKAIWRAKRDAILGFKLMLDKRRKLQQERQDSIREIYLNMNRDLLAPLRVSLQRRRFRTKFND
jgi:GT2 family glycosyltransferase